MPALPAPPGLISDRPGGPAWHLDRRAEHLGAGPEAILGAGLPGWLGDAGWTVDSPHVIELTEEERRQYGAWHKVGVHGAHLAATVAGLRERGAFPWRCLGL
jgi:hypothetical protein